MIEGDSGPGTLVKPAQSRRGLGKSEVYLGSGQRWGLPGQRVYTKV